MLRRKESQKENIAEKGNDGESDPDNDEASSSGEEGELKAKKNSSAKRVTDAKKMLKKQGSRIKLALEMPTDKIGVNDDIDDLGNEDEGDKSRPAFSKRLLKKQNSRKKIEMDMVVEKEEESDESDGEGESINILDESMDEDGDGMANAKSSIRSNAPTRQKSMSPMREAKAKEETATNTKYGDDVEDSHPSNLKTSAIFRGISRRTGP